MFEIIVSVNKVKDSLERSIVAERCVVVKCGGFLTLVVSTNHLSTIETEIDAAFSAIHHINAVYAPGLEPHALRAIRSVLNIDHRHGVVLIADRALDFLLLELFLLCFEGPTTGIISEMIVGVYSTEDGTALPAELSATVLTLHLVAAIGLLDRKLAIGALLRAVLNVKQVESFLYNIPCLLDICFVCTIAHHRHFTPLIRVKLLLALGAEPEATLTALALPLGFVNHSWLLAGLYRTPSEVGHRIDCLAD